MTGLGGRGRQGASRATAEFRLSLEHCTLAGDDSYTHAHTHVAHGECSAYWESVRVHGHVCVCVRKKLEVEGVNAFSFIVLCCVHKYLCTPSILDSGHHRFICVTKCF